jgi:MerR HTH family regulatory protein
MEEASWTLDELAERVDAALTVDYPGQSSGRVRAVPDRRAIRWYTTIGLIDRPVAHRGRTALYGPRHLLQLVAVKRLQAQGLPLVAIQRELAGATDAQLARVARLPSGSEPPLAAAAPSGAGSPSTGDALDGGRRPGKGSAKGAAGVAAARTTAGWTGAVGGRSQRSGFWRDQPAAFAVPAASDDAVHDPAASIAALRGVQLGDGTTLLLIPGREPDRADLEAIIDAARPLLAVLRERGLGHAAGDLDLGKGPRPVGGHEARHEPRREHP